eukprot:6212222-Pleurochrysis_carterae.AAC.2
MPLASVVTVSEPSPSGSADATSSSSNQPQDSNLRRYRHWLPRGPIGRSGPPNQNHARLHLAVITPTIKGRGASAGAGVGRAYGVAPGRGRSSEVCHGRYGDSRTWRAERECSASTHATRVQFGKKCMIVSVRLQMKGARDDSV